jgi:hypothetical protein
MQTTTDGALIAPNAPQSSSSAGPLLQPGQSAFNPIPTVNFGTPALPSTATKTVVTAKPAQADLAAKSANVDAATAATSTAQVYNPVTGTWGPYQAPATGQTPATATPPATTATPTATPAPTTTATTQQPATPANTAPSTATKQQILDLIQGGNVTLTKDQVSQIAGIDFSGFTQNPDGTFSSNLDSDQLKKIDAQNNYAPTPTADNTAQTAAYVQQKQAELDAQAQQNYNDYSNQLQQIANGSFPLTASQQSQVNALQQQFAQLLQQQQVANANYTGAVTTLGIRSGTSRYAPQIAQGDIQASINYGLSQVAKINTQASQALSALQQGFADNDFKLINAQYAALQDLMKEKDNSLQEMQQSIKDQLDAQTQKLAQQKSLLDIETTTINNVAQSALDDALKPDGTLDYDKLQQTADDYGVDVNQLYGAVLKQKDAATLQQQEETKFQTDQATAKLNQQKLQTDIDQAPLDASLKRAQIANTQATTAKTLADTASESPGTSSALSSQPTYAALSNTQKTAADAANNLLASLKEYRAAYDKYVDKSGGDYFGESAADLASKQAALVFQYSVAAGSGAVQKADADQIAKIIPNPTTLAGVGTAAFKGGKAGGLNAIDGQIDKFERQLQNLGLSSTELGDSSNNTVPNPDGGEPIEIID